MSNDSLIVSIVPFAVSVSPGCPPPFPFRFSPKTGVPEGLPRAYVAAALKWNRPSAVVKQP